jgi:hypothetical protein
MMTPLSFPDRYRGLCHCAEHAWAVLTQGFVTFVSPEDAHHLREARWYAIRCSHLAYAIRRVGPHKIGKRVRLHQQLFGVPAGCEIDHIDWNGLNNRRGNLRPCSRSQNIGNSRQQPGPSGFRGVIQIGNRWRARIGDERCYLGTFATIEEAARAYDAAAIERFGEFATLNFPPPARPPILGRAS